MKNQRPKNLNLFTIRFPLPAIVSILHRVSGFILFLLIALFLWALNESLTSEDQFNSLYAFFVTPWVKFLLWCCLSAFWFHFVAGIRHLLMDINIGIELKSGRLSALLTMIIAGIFILLTGLWLW